MTKETKECIKCPKYLTKIEALTMKLDALANPKPKKQLTDEEKEERKQKAEERKKQKEQEAEKNEQILKENIRLKTELLERFGVKV